MPQDAPVRRGTLLKQRYRVLSAQPLGEGGAGQVYRARDVTLNRICAVKILRRDHAGDPAFADTFAAEVQHLMYVHHHNIVNILDHGRLSSNGPPYYVMEFADQGSLLGYARSHRPTGYEFLPRLLRGIAEGLAYIHSTNRLHLDVKPENILFANGVPKISDLGVTKELSPRRAATYVRGTREYTHPELLSLMTRYKKRIPIRLLRGRFYYDLFSLGATLAKVRPLLTRLHPKQLALLDRLVARLREVKPFGRSSRYLSTEELLRDIATLDVFYLQPAGVAELAPAFVNTAPCRIPPLLNVPLSRRLRGLLEAPSLQRLRLVPQLDGVNFVYPGATHTRFEHSLGTYHTARQIFNALLADPTGNVLLSGDDIRTGLAAALLNDLGSYPFSHVLEELGSDWPLNRLDIRQSLVTGRLGGRGTDLSTILRGYDIEPKRVARLLDPRLEPHADRSGDRLIHSVLHGTLGANRLDYLERDSVHCGVPYGMMADKERLFASMIVDERYWQVAITKKGLASAEVFILALCTMFTQVYWHHAVRAVAAMLKAAVRAIPREDLSSKELMKRALSSDVVELLRWLRLKVPRSARPLIDPLIPGAGTRALYKRIFTLRRHRPPATDLNASKTLKAWERLQAPTLQLDDFVEELRRLLAKKLGRHVGTHDLVVDIPNLTADALPDVSVWYPALFDEPGGGFSTLSLESHFPHELLREFGSYTKKARIFASPAILREQPARTLNHLASDIFEQLTKQAPAGGDY
jgi:HD superfamily phosphohydrolase